VCLCLLFLYFSGSNRQAGSVALEYGTKFSRSLGWGSEADGSDGSEESIFGTGDANDVKLRSFPVCDDQYSELIPCLDRNMIFQSRMKLDLNLMEHYERHCLPPEKRFNCLIPPPHGYKVTGLPFVFLFSSYLYLIWIPSVSYKGVGWVHTLNFNLYFQDEPLDFVMSFAYRHKYLS
jgi:hypothetical protein